MTLGSEQGSLPRVTVLMPLWNAAPELLTAAIASVLGQSMPDFELLVIEDASPRPARDVLAAFADERIRHIFQEQRTSMALARNRGLREARAEYIAVCDGDDLCEPERLAQQLAFLENSPQCSVLGSQITIIDEQGRELGERSYPCAHAEIARAMPRYNPLAHPSVMFRKAAILEAGGYDEGPARVCEDYELWCRLAKRGLCFANLKESLLSYRVHAQASKRRLLRATLRDTLAIKRLYWRQGMSLRGRGRMLAERAMLALPSSAVYWLFCKTAIARPRSAP